jgi:endonuclease/exonuclease/phosphatase family metal-dependent hydrolase
MRFTILFFACMTAFSAACSGSNEPPDAGGVSSRRASSSRSLSSSRSASSAVSGSRSASSVSSISAQNSSSASSAGAGSSAGYDGSPYYSTTSAAGLYVHDRNTILRIGSMNGQIMGPAKQDRYNTFGVMASVATNFDILALQEVGSNWDPSDDTATRVMNAYVARVNGFAGMGAYSYVRGHQYAFVYRTSSVTLSESRLYTGTNSYGTNAFRYAPLLAKAVTQSGLSFVIMTVHTSPGFASREIPSILNALSEAAASYGETRLICLGDYNADTTYYSPGTAAQGWLNGFAPPQWYTVIRNGITTNVGGGKTYDRIQLSMPLAAFYTGTWGVMKYAEHYDVTICEGTGPTSTTPGTQFTENAISDHYPVWAEFRLHDVNAPAPPGG